MTHTGRVSALGMFTFVLLAIVAAQTPRRSPAQSKGTPAPATGQPKFKAIWERVPFPKDVQLVSVDCTGPETCWAAGDKSTIIHTTDGGKTWQVQLGGDPQASEEDLAQIFILDEKNGWARFERGRLLRTTDGSTWAELGKLPYGAHDIEFVSPDTGYLVTIVEKLYRTDDGGKSWKEMTNCSVDAQVAGLARTLKCTMRTIHFLSPTTGFLGGGAAYSMGGELSTLLKTADGGQTWNGTTIPDTKHRLRSVHFWSEKDGLAVSEGGQAYWTADGGATWTGSVNPPEWKSHYAHFENKIIVGVNERGTQIGYSFNGGRNFTSRPFGAPAEVRDVTFFDAQNGYLVGQHGMAYRYHIVPIDYKGEGVAAAAPMM